MQAMSMATIDLPKEVPQIGAWLKAEGRTFTERQVRVLKRAAERGYLFDPAPEPGDFGRCFSSDISSISCRRRGRYEECWPDPVCLLPGVLAWKEARRANPSLREWQQVGEPRHFLAWRRYRQILHDRPAVIAGRFTLEQDASRYNPVLGLQIDAGLQIIKPCLSDAQWPRLLHLVCPVAKGWLSFQRTLFSAQVPADDAELLAMHAVDLIEEQR
jgi:hypothetical protein